MEKRLYLKNDNLGFISKGKEQTGEQLGGKYVARVQTGIEKDGSPQYRYFTSRDEYEKFLATQRKTKQEGKPDKTKSGKGGNKKSSMKERLQSKLKKEHADSEQQTQNPKSRKVSGSHSKNRSVFPGNTRDIKKFKKGDLYLGEQ